MSLTDGSMSRGTAMSMKNIGRCRRRAMTFLTSSPLMMKCGAPVEEITMSLSTSWSKSSSNFTAEPPNSCASATAFSKVRLTTNTSRTPLETRCLTASSAISPAPMIIAERPSISPKIFFASSTAAKLTDTALRAISVSVRTSLATESAFLSSRSSTMPIAPASRAYW